MGDTQSNFENELAERIRAGDQKAFEKIFHRHYSRLCIFSNSYIKSLDAARDVVQEVFIKIWDNRENFNIRQSLKAYLYQAVRNHSLNVLLQKKQRLKLQERLQKHQHFEESDSETEFSDEKLSQKIWRLVEELPEKRRTIFILYRKHGLSYSEIADVMGITRKTVENQMGRALQFLREHLDL